MNFHEKISADLEVLLGPKHPMGYKPWILVPVLADVCPTSTSTSSLLLQDGLKEVINSILAGILLKQCLCGWDYGKKKSIELWPKKKKGSVLKVIKHL